MAKKNGDLIQARKEHRMDVRERVALLGKVDQTELVAMANALSRSKMDGWSNFLTGMGVSGRDKRTASNLRWTGLLMRETTAEEILASSNLARKIVELLPYEATREPIKFTGFEDDEKPLMDDFSRLDVRGNFFKGWSWARTYGGAGLLMMTDEPEEALDQPLNLKNIRELKSLVPLSRWELDVYSQDIDTDLQSPNFRLPKFYRLSVASGGTRIQTNVKIHYSRIIRFEGQALPPLLFIKNNFWGDSIFTGLQEAMRDFDASHSGIARVMEEFRFVVHKMPDLAEAFANGKEDSIRLRVQAAAASRTNTGTMIADKEEEVTIQSETFGGVTDVLDRMASRFAAHSEYPKIILFNESPSGMSATGMSELMGWYATVKARQCTYLEPKIDQLLSVMLAAKRGPTKGNVPEEWDYEFGNLWQESAKEKAEREKIEAETDDIRIQQGVQDEVDIMARRFPEKLEDQDPDTLRAEIEKEKAAQIQLQREAMAKQGPPPKPQPQA